jgi:hypothetical protein
MTMPKLQFSGIYKTAKEIPPRQLIDYYLKGDQQERREAGNEILRRLEQAIIWKKEREMLLEMTSQLDEHPEGYEGPCLCELCCSYGD